MNFIVTHPFTGSYVPVSPMEMEHDDEFETEREDRLEQVLNIIEDYFYDEVKYLVWNSLPSIIRYMDKETRHMLYDAEEVMQYINEPFTIWWNDTAKKEAEKLKESADFEEFSKMMAYNILMMLADPSFYKNYKKRLEDEGLSDDELEEMYNSDERRLDSLNQYIWERSVEAISDMVEEV